jgi:hypothetical protein
MLREPSPDEFINAAAFARLQRLKRPVLRGEDTRGDKQKAKLNEKSKHSVEYYAR